MQKSNATSYFYGETVTKH